MDEIKVHVIDKGRKYFYMRYIDPMTNKPVERSTKETKLALAERAAGVWQDELRTNRYAKPSKATWAEFRAKYETEVLSSMATDTYHKASCVLDIVERVLKPQRVRDITAAKLSYFQSEVRKGQKLKGRKQRPCSQATVDS